MRLGRYGGETMRFVGEILLSHIRSIDTLALPVRFAGGVVPAVVASLVRAKRGAIVST